MGDLKKAQQLRARKEMVRQKQQAAIEKRDIKANTTRSENIARRKKAAEKVGKTFSYKDTVKPIVESGPLNYGSPMKKSSCIKMYDSKGKPAGLMAEGSMAYMESISQEKSNLMQDVPIDNRGISQMSPYKMDDPDPNKKEEKEKQSARDKFQNAYLDKGGDIKKLQEATNRVIDEKGNVRANPGSIREYDSTIK